MLKIGYKTDRGKMKENNEDFLYVGEKKGLFIVADGLGGHKAGEIASHLAVKRIKECLLSVPLPSEDGEIVEIMERAVKLANKDIWEKASRSEEMSDMGTTVVVAIVRDDKLYVSHVGDSRAYLLSKGDFKRLTEDHSPVARMVREGQLTKEQARYHHLRNVVSRALGAEERVQVDTAVFSYKDGDLLLLCTDGLTDLLEDEEIKRIFLSVPDIQEVCNRLIEEANQLGGWDNITVIAAKKL